MGYFARGLKVTRETDVPLASMYKSLSMTPIQFWRLVTYGQSNLISLRRDRSSFIQTE
jgi:hypothetical protein